MEVKFSGKIQRRKDRHQPEVSKQTGFPSAATHYYEAPIDLHNELIQNQDATFYVRVEGNIWSNLKINDQDVLIIDRSLKLRHGRLALIVKDGEFDIIKFSEDRQQTEFELWGIVTYIIHDVL